jgi:hypothetical protein
MSVSHWYTSTEIINLVKEYNPGFMEVIITSSGVGGVVNYFNPLGFANDGVGCTLNGFRQQTTWGPTASIIYSNETLN